jgi:hypothetical protein
VAIWALFSKTKPFMPLITPSYISCPGCQNWRKNKNHRPMWVFFLQFCDVAKVAINNVFRKNGNIQSNYVLSSEKNKKKNPL